MNAAGVLVSCSVAGNKTPHRCSGIRLGRDWILTTGGILSSVLQDNNTRNTVSYWKSLLDTTYQDNLVRIKTRPPLETQVSFSVITSYAVDAKDEITSTNKHLFSKEQFLPQRAVRSSEDTNGNSSVSAIGQLPSSDVYGKCEEFNGVLKYIWRSTLVSAAVDKMLSSWVMGSISYNEDDSNVETESEISKQLLPLFVILKLLTDSDDISETDEYIKLVDILRDVFEPEGVLRRGQNVVVESTPFGNVCFHNSVSEGIISNVFGPSCCLLLTDASTAIGCEGAPIFVVIKRDGKPHRHLVGMVVCSLSWWRGEWVGFTLGVSLGPVVRRLLLPDSYVPSSVSLMPPDTFRNQLAGVDDSVVLVRCGVHWGSGVVVDSRDGIVLTCSHVVRNAQNSGVKIYWNSKQYFASVLFRSRDGFAYDAAVLRAGPGATFRSVNFSSIPAVKVVYRRPYFYVAMRKLAEVPQARFLQNEMREPVVAAGFSLFSEDDNVRPTVTRGIVTRVSDPVAMLQTTCCVQSGASGGALFRSTGDLVGLVSCNIMDTCTRALFPRINMAVPASVLAEPLNYYLRTGDIQYLSAMESKDPNIQRLWKLQNMISKL